MTIILEERSAVSPVVIGKIITARMAKIPPNVPSIVEDISLITPAGPPAERAA